jgi:hypothetical protein
VWLASFCLGGEAAATVSAVREWKGVSRFEAIEIVDLPIQNRDFP